MVKVKEVNEENFHNLANWLAKISEDDFEELDSETRRNLVNLIEMMKNYLGNSGILEAFLMKQKIKMLSDEISGLSYQILSSHPVPCSFEENYDDLNYHELEDLARKQQEQIDKALNQVSPIKEVIRTKSLYLNKSLQMIKKPNFRLMLFEYNEGIQSYFPHEDSTIERHKGKIIEETETQMKMLMKKYGAGSINKIIKNREKWDLEYSETSVKMKEIVMPLKKFSPEIFEESDVFMRSWARVDNFSVARQEFKEGRVEFCVISQLVNMDKCAIRAKIWTLNEVTTFEPEDSQTFECRFN